MTFLIATVPEMDCENTGAVVKRAMINAKKSGTFFYKVLMYGERFINPKICSTNVLALLPGSYSMFKSSGSCSHHYLEQDVTKN